MFGFPTSPCSRGGGGGSDGGGGGGGGGTPDKDLVFTRNLGSRPVWKKHGCVLLERCFDILCLDPVLQIREHCRNQVAEGKYGA